MKATPPKPIADQCRPRTAEMQFRLCKIAAKRGSNAEYLQKSGRNVGPQKTRRKSAGGLGNIFRIPTANRPQRRVLSVPFFEPSRGEKPPRTPTRAIVLMQNDQLVRGGEGKRAQQNCVNS